MTSSQTLVKELRSKGHLPALDGTVEAICSLTNDPLACVADLTTVILRDCSLTSNLIATANSALYGGAEPIKTVSAAIHTLGFELVRSLSIGLGIIKQMSDCAQDRNLYRLFAGAYFSGMLSMSLGQRLKKDVPEELFVIGILSGLPRLLLAHAYPDKYAALEQRTMAHRQELDEACLAVFGATYSELACDIARFWNLPADVIQVLKGKDRNNHWLTVVREAAEIANTMFGTVQGGGATMKAVEKRLQTLLRDEEFQLTDFVVQTCGSDQNTARFFKLTREDVEMLVRIVEWGRVKPADVAGLLNLGAANQQLKGSPPEDPAVVIGQVLTDLAIAARRATDVNQILLTSMEGIYRCLRPSCVLVAFPSRAARRLEGRLCLGDIGGVPVADFQIPLDDDASPAARCLASRKPLAASVKRDLPLPFLKRLNLDSLLLLPIVALGKTIGLYVVARESSLPFTEQEQMWSAAMVEHVGMAFERTKAARPG
jgi:HD-like signal output (HDOD) protein